MIKAWLGRAYRAVLLLIAATLLFGAGLFFPFALMEADWLTMLVSGGLLYVSWRFARQNWLLIKTPLPKVEKD